jgi:hypothetical protein
MTNGRLAPWVRALARTPVGRNERGMTGRFCRHLRAASGAVAIALVGQVCYPRHLMLEGVWWNPLVTAYEGDALAAEVSERADDFALRGGL